MMPRQILVMGLTAGTLIVSGLGGALADQTVTGLITIVDRTTNEIVIKRDDSTVGANSGAANAGGAKTGGTQADAVTEKYKLRDGVPESLHAGEKVTLSYTEANGVRTATSVAEEKK